MFSLEVGPILRSSARHKSTFAVVVLQLASTFMIVGSLLVIGSWFGSVGHLPTGYEQADLLGVRVRVPRAAAAPDDGARLAALPGVAAVARLDPPLRAETGAPTLLYADGARGARDVRGWTVTATRSIVDVLGLRFVEGSPPEPGAPADPRRAAPVILTRDLRDALFPGQPALGRIVASDDAPAGPVIGVVENVLLRERFYRDPTSIAFRLAAPADRGDASTLVRARPGRRDEVARALRQALGPDGPARLVTITPYGQVTPHFQAVASGLLTLFAVVGITIAIIALAGALAVSSFVVAERRRQIGIRRALGATRWDVFRYFLVESSIAAALGTGLGLALTLGLLLAMRRVFPGLPINWYYLTATALLLWLNATLAAAIPARDAARISPALAGQGRP